MSSADSIGSRETSSTPNGTDNKLISPSCKSEPDLATKSNTSPGFLMSTPKSTPSKMSVKVEKEDAPLALDVKHKTNGDLATSESKEKSSSALAASTNAGADSGKPEEKVMPLAAAPASSTSIPSPSARAKKTTLDLSSSIPKPVLPGDDKGHPERKRRASTDSMDSSTKASKSDTGDDAGKDDEEEDDNEDDDKMSQSRDYDPERLKAFNMFVRLFVDENLDRMVPISKQPKDKIQAILDACDRQFSEFHDRSRKRIRTYLKSCRRMRRCKENGWESLRPTPPHLTSATAESILAQACENESTNAKRMRMGLEPLAASPSSNNSLTHAATNGSGSSSQTSPSGGNLQAASSTSTQHSPQTPRTSPSAAASSSSALGAGSAMDFLRSAPITQAAFRPPRELPAPFLGASNGIFRPGFPYTPPAHHNTSSVIQHSQLSSNLQNGPTDLSLKKSPSGTSSPKNQLNSVEVATIKQLIAGYRESAAFLYRSADELEQLLMQQH